MSQPSPRESADAARAEQLYRQGDLTGAADAFLDLADRSRAVRAAHYRLRAAEALRDAGKLEAAARALDDIKRRHLQGDDPVRLDLLDAEIALQAGDSARAEALLAIPAGDLPVALRQRALELRARSEVASGRPFAAARTRAQLDRLLTGADRSANQKEIVDTLAQLDTATLKAKAQTLRPDDALMPWITEALKQQGSALPRTLRRPDRPVGTLLPGRGGNLTPEGYQGVHQVALLLPLSGRLAAVAQSIRDGFFAAYFADPEERRPDVRVYDSGDTPDTAIATYRNAVADGADHVVGPLRREAVGALFHQTLQVPALALNHPDSGEVPPPGSAEFGLLPGAEGAQAAEYVFERGITTAAIIAADADWAERAAHAFRAQFEADGGLVVGESRVREEEVNYNIAILKATGGMTGDASANAAVFISMRPQQARLLLPQMKLLGVTAPVFATSHVYSGTADAAADRDLDGLEFCDAPWLFGSVVGRPTLADMTSRLASVNGAGARLFAFGMDAYSLLPYLDWLLRHPDAYLDGATGQLYADGFGRIHRLLGWARIENGIAQPVQGALTTMPQPSGRQP
ncbi:MAG TPA: penicillin-binding protein activator [Rhodanobacteraceae bacterium]|nr:penicillin-binding protein activator [Rhodanobacteraceae bacterium]